MDLMNHVKFAAAFPLLGYSFAPGLPAGVSALFPLVGPSPPIPGF